VLNKKVHVLVFYTLFKRQSVYLRDRIVQYTST